MSRRLVFRIASSLLIAVSCAPKLVGPTAGGGDDFPNSKTVASALAGAVKLVPVWEQFDQVPDTQSADFSEADTILGDAVGQRISLAKARAAASIVDSTVWDLSDSAKGYVTVNQLHEDRFNRSVTRYRVLWNDAARDSQKGNETIVSITGTKEDKLSKKTISFTLWDSDGNGYMDSAVVSQQQPFLGLVRIVAIHAASTNDKNSVDSRKWRIHALHVIQTLGADTLQAYSVRDYDGDGMIFSIGAKNVISATLVKKGLFVLNNGLCVQSSAGLVATLGNSKPGIWDIGKFEMSSRFKDNHRERVRIAGYGADSLLKPNDSAQVLLSKIQDNNGSYDSSSVLFSVRSDAVAGDLGAYALTGYRISDVNNSGAIRQWTFSFTANTPLYRNTLPASVSGTIAAHEVFQDGTSGTLVASFAKGIFDVTFTAPDGKIHTFRCDANGEIIR